MPVMYSGLNDQTPLTVNNTSQNKKTKPVIAMPGQMYFQVLWKATRLSNDSRTGNIMVKKLMSR